MTRILAPCLAAVAVLGCAAPAGSAPGTSSAAPSPSAPLSTATAPPASPAAASPAPTAAAPAAAGCHPGDPLAGVYHPARLVVERPCITVSGVVDCVRSEADGDLHVRLRLDPAFAAVLTAGNDGQTCSGHPGPHLVVEIIPQHCGLQSQADAGDNCADRGGFTTPAAPPTGGHASITGPLVVDTAAGHGVGGTGWAEIHPAEQVSPTP